MNEFLKHPNAKALVTEADGAYGLTPLPAGRALDALVAEKVMGIVWDEKRCRVCGWQFRYHGCQPDDCSMRPRPANARVADQHAPYSTEIAAAWLVVEHLQKTRNLSLVIGLNACANGHQNGAKFYEGHHGLGHSIFDASEHPGWDAVTESVPLSICRAALAARASGSSDRE